MSIRSPFELGRIVERMAKLSPPRHSELVRGMVVELDSIANPADRRRFALGAIVAITRLSLIGFSRTTIHVPGRIVGASGLVFTGYYVSLVASESLADNLVISPFIAMWVANAILFAVALLLFWLPRRSGPMPGAETLAIGETGPA